jgi:hypothetical protein
MFQKTPAAFITAVVLSMTNVFRSLFLRYHQYTCKLRAGRSGDRIPMGRDFSQSSRPALGPTQPPIQWVPGLFTGGEKRPGRGVDHPPLSSARVKERVELYLYSPSEPLWRVLGWPLPLPFTVPWYCSLLWTLLLKHSEEYLTGYWP